MKNEHHHDEDACLPPVLAASTLSTPESAAEASELPSLVSDSLGPRRTPSAPMRLTPRDIDIIDHVFHARALRADQIRIALFTPGADSRCQLRLTLLVRNHYLDRLPRRTVNDPAVYLLSRRSLAGNRLMRGRWGEAAFREHMTKLGPLHHLLAVNDLRVRVERACKDLAWAMPRWLRPEELAPTFAREGLIPDAYFQVRRVVNGAERTSGFFLEVERVSKSSQVMRSKLQRYAAVAASGTYQRVFGTRALRVLFVFAGESSATDRHFVARSGQEAVRLGVTFARFTRLTDLTTLQPYQLLTSSIWTQPAGLSPSALFEAVQG